MNFYALNEVPFNGWDTLYGFGQADMILSAAGVSANVVLGSGACSMQMQAAGEGTRRAMGAGIVDMALQATGLGLLAQLGVGQSQMSLDAAGDGQLAALGAGQALLEMLADGYGGLAHYGQGSALLELVCDGEGRVATRQYGEGYAFLELRPINIPSHWRVVRGRGLAQMRLQHAGAGYVIAYDNPGTATMGLEAEGEGRINDKHYGAGTATMGLGVLRSIGRKYRQINGDGAATMGMSAQGWGLALPSASDLPPKARTMLVSAENRTIMVPKEAMVAQIAEAA